MMMNKSSHTSGLALLMVISIITLLTFVLIEFTFETKLNKIRIYNQQDRAQAKLNAEAGMKFALSKLRIYKVARNLLEQNESIKDIIGPDKLEAIITEEFVYPIPVPKDASIIQKTAVNDFMKESLLVGGVAISISPVSGFLNPNNLRIPAITDQEKQTASGKTPEAYIEEEMINSFRETFEREKEKNDDFAIAYGDIDPELLVKELKFFVNDKNIETGDDLAQFEATYQQKDIIPKHAPLSSISELYLLAGWDDTIIDLVKDKLTVHQVSIIPINKITDSQLRVLFPGITDEQVEDFFKYRDGDPQAENAQINEEGGPHPFRSVEDFKAAIVNRLSIVDSTTYDTRIKEFEVAGIKLGVAGMLFKVVSTGEYNRATYTLTAYISLPVKPPKKKNEGKDKKDTTKKTDTEKIDEEEEEVEEENKKDSEKEEPLQLLEPRIIELIIN